MIFYYKVNVSSHIIKLFCYEFVKLLNFKFQYIMKLLLLKFIKCL